MFFGESLHEYRVLVAIAVTEASVASMLISVQCGRRVSVGYCDCDYDKGQFLLDALISPACLLTGRVTVLASCVDAILVANSSLCDSARVVVNV